MTKPTFSFFTGVQSLGNVYRVTNQINAKFIDFNIPFTTTKGRISANLGGKTRLITIQGVVDGSDWSGSTVQDRHRNFITTMENWINATVQTSRSFTDSLNFTYSVDCVDWTWIHSKDDPNRILYSIILIES